ncbi:FAD-dependent oxidoreductase [Gordonia sp. KTR9]|uniref:FAD-dependent oxidoreductase n=1 Tax=Gordonia sp. KTR9 TaxID=337191 RepID=UPI00027DDBB2|nr:FAD-dependent oxidoreductase [Gordonia sp. KTR9]AFR48165.1 NADPH-dependent glutamate synthase beta chain-related oxidoreductase [Gordonia sp. KTR9]
MAHVITRSCCSDASCVPVCPVNCIHPTPEEPGYETAEMLYIDPDACIDCGACVDVCPVTAIVADFDLTEVTEPYERINAAYYGGPGIAATDTAPSPGGRTMQAASSGQPLPLRVAIVGSGPAGMYAAEDLVLRRDVRAEVNVFERLPMPWGLVRYGVAPDHQDTKAVTTTFARTAARASVTMFLNVEIGEHISHSELLDHHDAVIYAVGAGSSRSLGIEGEQLPGSHGASDFVAWYNGHPYAASKQFDLSGERAVIIGNGNVAIDVARLLLSEPEILERTDMARHAVRAISDSEITEVQVIARRGPDVAAFTYSELLALSQRRDFDTLVDLSVEEIDEYFTRAESAEADHATLAKLALLRELAARDEEPGRKRILLRFNTRPVEIYGETSVEGVRLTTNHSMQASDSQEQNVSCCLVLRSIGYQGESIKNLPADPVTKVLKNTGGVVDATEDGVSEGVYAVGWIKRGPKGVIGTNKKCSQNTVERLIDNHKNGLHTDPIGSQADLVDLVSERQPNWLRMSDADRIDGHERAAGRSQGCPRIKIVDVDEMVEVAQSATAVLTRR